MVENEHCDKVAKIRLLKYEIAIITLYCVIHYQK